MRDAIKRSSEVISCSERDRSPSERKRRTGGAPPPPGRGNYARGASTPRRERAAAVANTNTRMQTSHVLPGRGRGCGEWRGPCGCGTQGVSLSPEFSSRKRLVCLCRCATSEQRVPRQPVSIHTGHTAAASRHDVMCDQLSDPYCTPRGWRDLHLSSTKVPLIRIRDLSGETSACRQRFARASDLTQSRRGRP